MSRPSHDALMAAQHALADARDQESEAGNPAVARYLNDLSLSVFHVALEDDAEARLNRAYAVADTAAGR